MTAKANEYHLNAWERLPRAKLLCVWIYRLVGLWLSQTSRLSVKEFLAPLPKTTYSSLSTFAGLMRVVEYTL